MVNMTRKLEALERKVADARREEREIRMAQQQAEVEVKTAREALADHLSQDDADIEPRELHAALTKARGGADRDWEVQIVAKQRRLQRVEGERDRFIAENIAELVAEQVPAAVAAAEALEAQVAGIEEAVRNCGAVEQRMIALLRPIQGVDGTDVPTPNVDALRMECQRVLDRGIPVPLPRSFTEQAEDPTIRSAA